MDNLEVRRLAGQTWSEVDDLAVDLTQRQIELNHRFCLLCCATVHL
jgi:hypothetical protein